MKLTPLYQKHLDLGATMYTTGMGYEMPAYYSSVEEEAKNVRERVGMNDVSLMGRLDVKGTDALALTQYLIVNNAAALSDGQALYSVMCDAEGLIVDDVIVMRYSAEHLRIITSSMLLHDDRRPGTEVARGVERHHGHRSLEAEILPLRVWQVRGYSVHDRPAGIFG